MTAAGRFTNAFTRTPRLIVLTSRTHAALYRRTGGRFLPRWFAGAPVMLLETVGRRSGQPRATPVLYLTDGDDLVVIPANAGSHGAPAWWLNLRAAGEATAVVRGSRRRVRPRIATGAERDRLWRLYAAMYPPLEDYVRFTDRALPVVVLEPWPGSAVQ